MNSYIKLTYSIGLRVMYARYTSDSRMSAARLNSRTVVVSMAVSPRCAKRKRARVNVAYRCQRDGVYIKK